MSRQLFSEMLLATPFSATTVHPQNFRVGHGSQPNGNMQVTQTSLVALGPMKAPFRVWGFPLFVRSAEPVRRTLNLGDAMQPVSDEYKDQIELTTTAADIVADREGAQVNLLGRLSYSTSSPNGCIASVRTVLGWLPCRTARTSRNP